MTPFIESVQKATEALRQFAAAWEKPPPIKVESSRADRLPVKRPPS